MPPFSVLGGISMIMTFKPFIIFWIVTHTNETLAIEFLARLTHLLDR